MACVKDKSSAACPVWAAASVINGPALMVQRNQLQGRRFRRVHPVGDQAIARFCIGDPLQDVFDDAHPDAIASLLTVFGTSILYYW